MAPKEPVLEEADLRAALDAPDGPKWELAGGKLVKAVRCESFPAALEFVGEVGRLAEEANHHPDIDIRYRSVTLALVTHDSGGITRHDLELARKIDGIRTGLAGGRPRVSSPSSRICSSRTASAPPRKRCPTGRTAWLRQPCTPHWASAVTEPPMR